MSMKNAIGFYRVGDAWLPEASILLRKMNPPASKELATLVNNTFGVFRGASLIQNKLSMLQCYKLHTEQAALLNWTGNDAYNHTAVNAPIHWPWHGISSNSGGVNYINTNYAPVGDPKISASNFMWGQEYIINTALAGNIMGGQSSTADTRNILNPRNANNESTSYNGGSLLTIPNRLSSIGLHVMETPHDYYVDNVFLGNRSNNLSLSTIPLNIFNYNSNGTPTAGRVGMVSWVFAGQLLNEFERTVFKAGIDYFEANIDQCLNLGMDIIVNGGFADGTGWVVSSPLWTIADGKANFTNGGSNSYLTQSLILFAGDNYLVEFDFESTGLGNLGFYSETTATSLFENYIPTNHYQGLITGHYKNVYRVQRDASQLRIYGQGTGPNSFSITNFSMRKINV